MGVTYRLMRRKKWLYSMDPYCPRCHRLMVLGPLPCPGSKLYMITATIEHITTRYNIKTRRLIPSKEEQTLARTHRKGRTILICNQCNMETEMEIRLRVPITELWKKSGYKPGNILVQFKRIVFDYFRRLMLPPIKRYLVPGTFYWKVVNEEFADPYIVKEEVELTHKGLVVN